MPSRKSPEKGTTVMKARENPLNVRNREPKQGEQFTEPKVGGLYPFAAAVAAGAALFLLAVGLTVA